MRNDLLSTRHTAAMALVACLALPGCGDAGVAEAVAHVVDARPAPRAADAAPTPAPRALPMPQQTGSAALQSYREDLDPSHMAIGSYGD